MPYRTVTCERCGKQEIQESRRGRPPKHCIPCKAQAHRDAVAKSTETRRKAPLKIDRPSAHRDRLEREKEEAAKIIAAKEARAEDAKEEAKIHFLPKVTENVGVGAGHTRTGASLIPAGLKIAAGRNDHLTAGGKQINMGPFENRAMPEPPPNLPPDAVEEWYRIAPSLARLGLLKPEDRAALTAYVLCWDRLINATAQGDLISASREMRAWCNQFGLTPASEQRLPSAEQEDDPFSETG